MTQNDVEVIDLHPFQRNIDALFDPAGAEIEMRPGISAEFRPQKIAVARNFRQHAAEQNFAHSPAVKRGRIDEVHAAVNRDTDAAQRFGDIDGPEFLSQR